ncbi:DUF3238 domain-containing protein, partial [Metabacillus litoralis]|uniref:DUF3238 domain-containing protein n=2 Tax=Metabacillus TaxID=2675233 RepID=UPI00203FB0DA
KILNSKYLVLPLALAGALYGNNIVMAAEDPVEINYSKDSLTLEFNQEADHYEVYKNGGLIYSGKDEKFVDKDIDSGQNYKVGIFKKNKLDDIIEVKTNKEEKDNQSTRVLNQEDDIDLLEQQINEGYLETLSTTNFVKLKWSNIIDDDGFYEIYRDEKKIGETNGLTFIDKNVKEGQRYRYEVLAQVEVDETKKNQIDLELKENKLDLTEEQKRELYQSRGVMTKIVDIPIKNSDELKGTTNFFGEKVTKDSNNDVSTLALPKSEEYAFIYRTFIPQKSVMDPYSAYWLAGDNRSGFDPYSNKFRTESNVNVGFWMPYMTHFPETGQSHKCYTSACVAPYAWTKQASTDGIKLTKDLVTTTKMQWRVNHDVGIPFSSMYPNINYYYNATLTKSSLSITGSHDKAPAHEFYMFPASGSTSYVTIERWWVDSSWDFGMLMPGAPQDYFNFSM